MVGVVVRADHLAINGVMGIENKAKVFFHGLAEFHWIVDDVPIPRDEGLFGSGFESRDWQIEVI